MLVLAAAYVSVSTVPVMRPAINGLTAAVVGILLATTYRLGKANIADRITLGIALASIVAGTVLGISAALIVVAAGLLGICEVSISGHSTWYMVMKLLTGTGTPYFGWVGRHWHRKGAPFSPAT
jgi:chromate transport protein ChrA